MHSESNVKQLIAENPDNTVTINICSAQGDSYREYAVKDLWIKENLDLM